MLSDWSAECSHDDPMLVVPWESPDDPALRFIDLRENPYDLDHIPEAEQHPALLQALRALNATRSPVFTAKCDAWTMDEDELDAARDVLAVPAAEAANGFTSYLDLIWRDRSTFLSAPQQQHRLDRLTRLLVPLDHPFAMVECILRPALVDLTGPQEGFAITLYVKAVGTDPPHAYQHWTAALAAVVTLLRSRDIRRRLEPSFVVIPAGNCIALCLMPSQKYGGRGRARTCNRELRRLVLYPVELLAQGSPGHVSIVLNAPRIKPQQHAFQARALARSAR